MKHKNQHYEGVLLEDINHKFDVLVEMITGMNKELKNNTQDLSTVKSDVAVIKSVVTHQSGQLKNHGSRINKLELKVSN